MHQAVPAGLPDGRSSRPGVRDRVVGQNSAVRSAAFGHAVDEPPPKAQHPRLAGHRLLPPGSQECAIEVGGYRHQFGRAGHHGDPHRGVGCSYEYRPGQHVARPIPAWVVGHLETAVPMRDIEHPVLPDCGERSLIELPLGLSAVDHRQLTAAQSRRSSHATGSEDTLLARVASSAGCREEMVPAPISEPQPTQSPPQAPWRV